MTLQIVILFLDLKQIFYRDNLCLMPAVIENQQRGWFGTISVT